MHTPYEYDIDYPKTVPEADLIDAAGKHVNKNSVTDFIINADISLPQGEKLSMDKVVNRAVDKHGKIVGTYHVKLISCLQCIKQIYILTYNQKE